VGHRDVLCGLHIENGGSWSPPSAPLPKDAPEEASHLPPESAYFLAVNRNKRSVTVNFKHQEGLEILHRLVQSSHVLVENFVPGKLASMGLGWEDCKRINPRLVYASITGAMLFLSAFTLILLVPAGYGQTGPYRQAPGYDVVIEAEAGLMHMLVCCSVSSRVIRSHPSQHRRI